jgi:hypothetical protein
MRQTGCVIVSLSLACRPQGLGNEVEAIVSEEHLNADEHGRRAEYAPIGRRLRFGLKLRNHVCRVCALEELARIETCPGQKLHQHRPLRKIGLLGPDTGKNRGDVFRTLAVGDGDERAPAERRVVERTPVWISREGDALALGPAL